MVITLSKLKLRMPGHGNNTIKHNKGMVLALSNQKIADIARAR